MSGSGSAYAASPPLAIGTRATRRSLILPAAASAAPSARALHDPPPLDEIAVAQGAWHGTLTYLDYSPPHRLVVLPTRPA